MNIFEQGLVITPEVTLFISTNQVEKKVAIYEKMHQKRGQTMPKQIVSFGEKATNKELQKKEIQPYFFENSQYFLEFEFIDGVNIVECLHPLAKVKNSFHFNPRKNLATFSLSTGNDIGWFTLPIAYKNEQGKKEIVLRFEILPTKMDLQQDLETIKKEISQYYPLWLFSFAQKTEQGADNTLQGGAYFPLFWLAHFRQLQQDFQVALLTISQTPHCRLQETFRFYSPARLKNQLSPKQEEQIQNNLKQGHLHKKYSVSRKVLSVDTPENRFVKFVVQDCLKNLRQIEKKLIQEENIETFSSCFFTQLDSWQQPLKQFLNRPFVRAIGDFKGLKKATLVLQQKTGYSRLFAIWQELKLYLNFLTKKDCFVSIKSINELYEIWCFLMVKKLLVTEVGFYEKVTEKTKLVLNRNLEYQLLDGKQGAFHFENSEGIQISLYHEKSFKQNHLKLNTQKPDICLEVKYPNLKPFIWLFDAKYRLDDSYGEDLVPQDAINQMHRYRDAIILGDVPNKNRPVLGAFALYPGFFDQRIEDNPYENAIDSVGIGAFALLPSEMGYQWLANFLKLQLKDNKFLPQKAERLHLQPSSRISSLAMRQSYIPDLVLLVSLGNAVNENGILRSENYFAQFRQNTAQFYHIPKKYFDEKYGDYLIQEIRFLGLAEMINNHRVIEKIWQVKRVKIKARKDISCKQAGYMSNSLEEYYLFEIDKPLQLFQPINNIPQGFTNAMKMTRLSDVVNTNCFTDIKVIYEQFIKKD